MEERNKNEIFRGIIEGVKKNCSIKKISIHSSVISPYDPGYYGPMNPTNLKRLFKAFRTNQFITSANLKFCSIGEAGLKCIASFLKENKSLLKLNLCNLKKKIIYISRKFYWKKRLE